jgi:hypothetical protein
VSAFVKEVADEPVAALWEATIEAEAEVKEEPMLGG